MAYAYAFDVIIPCMTFLVDVIIPCDYSFPRLFNLSFLVIKHLST